MCSMKRLQLAVLFLIAAALLAGTRALAWRNPSRPKRVVFSVDLVPTPGSDEPNASGVAKLQGDLYWDWQWGGQYLIGDLTVSCRGLKPLRRYLANIPYLTEAYFTTDATGKGVGKIPDQYFPPGSTLEVLRDDTVNGTPTLIPVLEGTLF